MVGCPNCGMIVADISLSDEDINNLYSEKYFMGAEYTDYVADRQLHISNFKRKINRIKKIVGSIEKKKIFEIGCAYGFFLKTIENQCESAIGIDISQDAIEYANKCEKVNAISGDFLDYSESSIYGDLCGAPNIVCMWDVIEHLTKPREYLEKAYNLLDEDGYICITTGDMGSLNARIRGRKWRQIHPPTHLSYFSKKTLYMLLENVGFEVCDVSYLWNRLSVRNIIYSILCLRFNKTQWYEKHKNDWFMDLSVQANFHDYMFFIAHKK